jgi:hypothetical protein
VRLARVYRWRAAGADKVSLAGDEVKGYFYEPSPYGPRPNQYARVFGAPPDFAGFGLLIAHWFSLKRPYSFARWGYQFSN